MTSDLTAARAIQGLFQRAATAAKSGTTVVFVFKEIEHFLPSQHASAASLDISVSSITAMVKYHLGLSENQHIPFFLFGVTNHPERLDMTDLNRGFADKLHIKLRMGINVSICEDQPFPNTTMTWILQDGRVWRLHPKATQLQR